MFGVRYVLDLYKSNSSYKTTLGWGRDIYRRDGQLFSPMLKKIEVPIVPHDKCQENLGKEIKIQDFSLHESFICAGGESKNDVCIDDTGSPLVCQIDGASKQYYQAGILSWGENYFGLLIDLYFNLL
jgi:secreted trypsin-like serine protease